MKQLRIATWNIACGRTINSLERFDYSKQPDLKYFAEQINAVKPDVICLQESQARGEESFAKVLAALTNLPYVFDTATCPSHIDKGYTLNNVILSRHPIGAVSAHQLPMTTLPLTIHGKPVAPYPRYLQLAAIDDITIANVQAEPLGFFGYDYAMGKGHSYAAEIETLFMQQLPQNAPVVFAADFNTDTIIKSYPNLCTKYNFRDLVATDSKPHGGQPDHILISGHIVPAGTATIVKTKTDHFLCFADVQAWHGRPD